MKLYIISNDEFDYDTFRSAVVAADTEEEAQCIHPNYHNYDFYNLEDIKTGILNASKSAFRGNDRTWVQNSDHVEAKYIGEAGPDIKFGVVHTSFRAG